MISTPELQRNAVSARRRPSRSGSACKRRSARRTSPRCARWTRSKLRQRRRRGRIQSVGHDRRQACCPASSSRCSSKGEQAPVPLIAGFNSGEIRSLSLLAPPVPASAADYEATIRDRYGDLADEFLQALSERRHAGEHLRDDARRALRLDRGAAGAQPGGDRPAVLSLFVGSRLSGRRRAGSTPSTPANCPMCSARSTARRALAEEPATTPETKLSEAMVEYWTSFARSGVPGQRTTPIGPLRSATPAPTCISRTPRSKPG